MRILTTLPFHGIPPLANGDTIELMDLSDTDSLGADMARAQAVVQRAKDADWLILDSTAGQYKADVMAADMLAVLPNPPKVILFGSMFEPSGSTSRYWLEKQALQLADRRIVHYIVQSTEELTVFPEIWGVDPSKLRLVPYFASLTEEALTELDPILSQPPTLDVFAGGNALRDYRALVEAVRMLPEYQFFFATHRLKDMDDLPPNLTAHQVSHQEFMERMASSRVVVTPVRQGLRRAAGQQTYLNAMFMEKVSVVSDTFGVRDHITPGESGMVVEGTPESYVEAIRWALDPQNAEAVMAMHKAASQAVRDSFTYDRFVVRLGKAFSELIVGE